MLRPIPVIVSAILMSRPSMPRDEAVRYARVVQEEAQARDFDPFTAVAIIHFESRWRAHAVSPDGEDYGLGQVRARFMSGCRNDPDPVRDPSPACRAAKSSLLVGEFGIRRMAHIITANRELCREKVGSAWFPQWLAGYQGLNRPGLQKWCAPSERTYDVIAYQKKLAMLLGPAPKAAPGPSRVARGVGKTKATSPATSEPVLLPAPPDPRASAAGSIERRVVAKRSPKGSSRLRSSAAHPDEDRR
jgi:hypothetical protein